MVEARVADTQDNIHQGQTALISKKERYVQIYDMITAGIVIIIAINIKILDNRL